MALNSGKILMRRGQEVNFDPNKMTPGEWAVSLDSKYVRMCFSPGVCVRMATYDAFEADMVQIQRILAECQTIEEAVERINDEISVKSQAIAEYASQAKQYRDEAEQFRNEAEQFRDSAESIVNVGVATTEKAGLVKPDGATIAVDPDGTIHAIGGGGGASGTMNYDNLENKPSINGIELSGNNDLSSLGIQPAGDYLTVEADPTVPQWAKSENKPTYTASEVGADVVGSADTAYENAKKYTDDKFEGLKDANDATLSIQKNGTTIGTFTANSSTDKTVNIIVPTKTSELNNDSGFINSAITLDTLEEIEANTESGKFAGALAVKELNNNLGGLRFGKDGEGNVGYFGDDDILIPFSRIAKGTFTIKYEMQVIELGFRPKYILISTLGKENNVNVPSFIFEYDEEYSTETIRRMGVASSNSATVDYDMAMVNHLTILDNGFSVKAINTGYSNKIAHYIAF